MRPLKAPPKRLSTRVATKNELEMIHSCPRLLSTKGSHASKKPAQRINDMLQILIKAMVTQQRSNDSFSQREKTIPQGQQLSHRNGQQRKSHRSTGILEGLGSW